MTVLFFVIVLLVCVYFYVKKYISQRQREEKQKVGKLLHDFVPSINSILGCVEALKNEENDEQKQEKYLGIIELEAENILQSVISGMSGISNNERIKNCAEIVSLTCRGFTHDAKKKGIKLDCHCDSDSYVDFDTRKLYRVISSLVDNSIKYNKIGGEIDVIVKDDSNYVVIECEDTGVGIKPENITKIFSKGFKEDENLPGFGYGLSKVREIVSENGGHIKLESECDKGTKFTLKLRKSKQNSRIESKTEILPTRVK